MAIGTRLLDQRRRVVALSEFPPCTTGLKEGE